MSERYNAGGFVPGPIKVAVHRGETVWRPDGRVQRWTGERWVTIGRVDPTGVIRANHRPDAPAKEA